MCARPAVQYVDLTGDDDGRDVAPSVAADLLLAAQHRATAAEAYAHLLQSMLWSSRQEVKDLEARVAVLDSSRQKAEALEARVAVLDCVVCMEAERQVRFKCGHVCACTSCARKLQPKRCPICRVTFASFTKVFFS